MLNLDVKKKDVKSLCMEVDLNGEGNCMEFSEFIGLYRKLTTRQDLDEIFAQETSGNVMTKQEFTEFVKKHQVSASPEQRIASLQTTMAACDFLLFYPRNA